MSFSNPRAENPCQKYIEFKGDNGTWKYWDKEEEKQVFIDLPIFFIVLDQLSTIKGFSDEHNCGIFSNEVKYLGKEVLKVRSFKGGISITGKYSDIKGEVKSAGGKFTKSIYALMIDKEGDNHEIVNFQLSGAAFSAWMDFKFSAQQHIVSITDEIIKEKKGAISYYKPVFRRYNIDQKYVPIATQADRVLQKYFHDREEQEFEKEAAKEVETDDSPVYKAEQVDKTEAEIYHEHTFEQDKINFPTGSAPAAADDDLPF
jgi:hypothetical protein